MGKTVGTRYCSHEHVILKLCEVERIDEQVSVVQPAVLMCHYCGQVKLLYADGRVVVVKEEGKVTRENDVNQSTADTKD